MDLWYKCRRLATQSGPEYGARDFSLELEEQSLSRNSDLLFSTFLFWALRAEWKTTAKHHSIVQLTWNFLNKKAFFFFGQKPYLVMLGAVVKSFLIEATYDSRSSYAIVARVNQLDCISLLMGVPFVIPDHFESRKRIHWMPLLSSIYACKWQSAIPHTVPRYAACKLSLDARRCAVKRILDWHHWLL